MKIAVTGGAGFIGSTVARRYVDEGHEVTVIDNLATGKRENVPAEARFVEMDILQENLPTLMIKEKFEIVSHHAAQLYITKSVLSPVEDATINIIGGLKLYEACVLSGVKKVIFASSGGTVYGEHEILPSTELSSTNPCSPYGVSKLTNEKYLSYFKSTHGLDFVALRYTNVYGPRQNPFGDAGIVAIFTEQLLRGDTPIVYGDGFQTRDYVFIDDVVSANVAALREDVSGIFNVSTAREQSVLQVLNSIQLHLGLEVDPDFRAARKAEQRRSCCSFEVFEAATGWRPKVEFDAGIETTVNYFRQLVR